MEWRFDVHTKYYTTELYAGITGAISKLAGKYTASTLVHILVWQPTYC